MSTLLSSRRFAMPVPQSILQSHVDSARYAKCVEVSKRVRWDIDRDVIRGRSFDFAKRFLPDGLSKVDRLDVPHRERATAAEPDPGPHLRQHVRPGRALHRRQGARREPRVRARRPERAAGARALRRRGDQAPGAVPPHRAHVRGRHARRLHVRAGTQRRRLGRALEVHVGRAGADLPHRALRAGALSGEHRHGRPCVRAVEGRVPAPRERGIAARDPGRDGMGAREREAHVAGARCGRGRPDRAGRRRRRHPAGPVARRTRITSSRSAAGP